jgi:hypothetical protein
MVKQEAGMEPTTTVSVGSKEYVDRENELRSKSSRRLEKIMNLVTINCESALRSSDPGQMARHITSARKYYAIMLRHSLRFRLTARDVNDLQNRSVQLESLIARLEARFEAKTAVRARALGSEIGDVNHTQM